MPIPASEQSRRAARRGFTLLEIIIVLSIVAVLIGLCIPFISGMLREEKMREPVRELQALAKVTRNRAMSERTPYEICFTATGFQGRKQVLYTDEEKKQTPSVDQGNTQTSGSAQADGDQPQDDIVAQYALSPDMTCQLLYWGNRQWVDPAADNDPGQCRWVFQASGLCNPLRVQFHKGTAWIEVAFNPLTADVQDERYLFPD